MGERGPAPRRADQRRRHTKASDQPTKAATAYAVATPPRPADPSWHPIARNWYEALGNSGQSRFYEASDWELAYVTAESMSVEFKPRPLVAGGEVHLVKQPPRAAAMMAWLRAGAVLLVAEGDRRRAALELERPKPNGGGGDVAWIDEARQRLGGTA